MVADKHSVSAAQAAAMGMLAPAEGVAAMQLLLRRATASSGAPGGVLGAAPARYWRLLLQGARQKIPGLFAALGTAAEVRLRSTSCADAVFCLAKLSVCRIQRAWPILGGCMLQEMS